MNPKITIIVPVFNVEDYLEQTIDSIISQTCFKDIEAILVDDKSTDSSADIIKEYENRFDNIRAIYFDECSGFPGKPRNVGMKHAKAPYIMFLDSDDYLESDSCEILYDAITGEDADIVSASFTTRTRNGKEKFNEWAWVSTLTSMDLEKAERIEKTRKILSDEDFKLVVTDIDKNGSVLGNPNVWAKIFRKSLIEDVEYPEDIVAQDSVFLLESFFKAEKIVFINEITVHHNNVRKKGKDKSVSFIKNEKNLYGRLRAYDMMHDISVKYSKEELFYHYALGPKLLHWYDNYMMKTEIPKKDLEELFRRYSHLFSKCYRSKVKLPETTRKVFKEIDTNNFSKAARIVEKQKSPSKDRNNGFSKLKSISKKIFK